MFFKVNEFMWNLTQDEVLLDLQLLVNVLHRQSTHPVGRLEITVSSVGVKKNR